MSLEAPCGKNPVYHTGKLFTVIGNLISSKIYEKTGLENTVFMTSQMGGAIINPWKVAVGLTTSKPISLKLRKTIEKIVFDELMDHARITQEIISGKIKLYS